MRHHHALFGIMLFLVAVAVECMLYAARRRRYPWREAFAALGVSVGSRITNLATAFVQVVAYSAIYQFRIVDLQIRGTLAWIAIIVAVDFLYYCHHRCSHRVRWLWASHAVHHRAERLTLSTAMQLAWFSAASLAWLFWLPLALLGVPVYAVGIAVGLNLFYQFWLHTETIGRLGPIEWIFNTPSHHRVHHSTNAEYIDKNFGGILIVFDRLFGTFTQETEPCRYGITGAASTYNPLRIAFEEWINLFRDMRREKSWRRRVAICFGAPAASEIEEDPAHALEPTPTVRSSIALSETSAA